MSDEELRFTQLHWTQQCQRDMDTQRRTQPLTPLGILISLWNSLIKNKSRKQPFLQNHIICDYRCRKSRVELCGKASAGRKSTHSDCGRIHGERRWGQYRLVFGGTGSVLGGNDNTWRNLLSTGPLGKTENIKRKKNFLPLPKTPKPSPPHDPFVLFFWHLNSRFDLRNRPFSQECCPWRDILKFKILAFWKNRTPFIDQNALSEKGIKHSGTGRP